MKKHLVMKKYLVPFAVTAMLFSSASFAATDTYLQLKGSKGSSQVISCPNGTCSIQTLVADSYTVSVVDAQGKSAPVNGKYECTIVSPRDAASGLPTGKRMHKPFVITKEMSVSSIDIAEDETNLSFTCTNTTPKPVTTSVTTESNTVKTATYDLKAAKK